MFCQDPSIQQATQGGNRGGTDEYNPFADGANQTRPAAGVCMV